MVVLGIIRFLYEMCVIHIYRQKRFYTSLLGCLSVLILVGILFVPPAHFPHDAYIQIEEGASTTSAGNELERTHIISSATVFKILARLSGTEENIQSGRYLFDRPMGVLEILYRITNGISGIDAVRVTIPEGFTSYQIADVLVEALPLLNAAEFRDKAEKEEGYLFPDTYIFPKDATADEVIARFHDNFYTRIRAVQGDIDTYGKPMSEVITMASLLEREGRTPEERRIIADILWKRFEADMALQVDAVFGYIHQRETFHPSLKDLEIDSPYNTYKNRGLPPGPIANPGIESIEAAVTPESTEYWYYLTGTDGEMHYATTFEEHKENRLRYLK